MSRVVADGYNSCTCEVVARGGADTAVCHLFFPCDTAIYDLRDEKWQLTNPWHAVWMPGGRQRGHIQRELWVYAQLTSGIGEYGFGVRLRRFQSNTVLGASEPERRTLPAGDRLSVLEVVFKMTKVPFPQPEPYVFELFADGQPVDGWVSYL